jgi:hypothetical protein
MTIPQVVYYDGQAAEGKNVIVNGGLAFFVSKLTSAFIKS